MRHLLNTLFVTSEDIYLSLDGENVVANRDQQAVARYPLHTLSGIVTFSYAGASPALMGACAKRDVSLAFCTPRGRFLARVTGESSGNVLLRRAQYRAADDPAPAAAWPGAWSSARCTTPGGASSAPAGITASGWMTRRLLPSPPS